VATWRSVYVGTYQPADRPGLFHLRLHLESGRLEVRGAVSGVARPSFITLGPSGDRLYAASEAAGGAEGEVCAFAVDAASGDLTPINRQPAHGRSTCHVSVDATGRWLVAANYGSPTVAVLPIAADGSLGPARTVLRHEGFSVHPRQAQPHPHSANPDPENRFIYCPDLGLDRVLIYGLDAASGELRPAGGLVLAPGAGPRHFAFHPRLPQAYVVNEIDSTVVALARAADGGLRPLQTVSALPPGFTGQSTSAHVAVHPAGHALYVSNRGADSIAAWAIDPRSGRLEALGHAPSGGRTPRHFAVDPDGRLLLAANQDSDTVVTLQIGPDGALRATGERLGLPSPVCLRFGRDWQG